uniref:Histidine kinase/HSP90-like ATPase domain-containing protein n=1 Tax=Chrysotila carterae TaxID=13221 RepID=A0A7S4AZ72_CHRCT
MAGQSLESPQTAPYQRQRLMKSSLLRACRLRGGNAQQQGETFEFKAEIAQLMSLIVNAFYSNKDVFLRELISNAADAIDKVRHESLTNPAILEAEPDLHISLIPDAGAKTLTVWDTGVGMTKEELQQNLGTIAHSGTKAFMEAMRKGEAELPLIGQFGVGFYSAFLVADYVEVFSRRGEGDVFRWASDAKGSYSIELADFEGLKRGTAVVLHLKEDQLDLLNPQTLRELVKTHSQFVTHPIRLRQATAPATPGTEAGESAPSSPPSAEAAAAGVEPPLSDVSVEDVPAEGNTPTPSDQTAAVEGWAVLNQQPPIWMQPPSELTHAEYAAFYKAISGDFDEHLALKHFSVEGQIGMRALLFIPKRAPFDAFERETRSNQLRLYVRRVYVAERVEQLCPEWLSFIRGVVDSDDLPLNVSREMLQQSNKLLKIMRRNIVKKVIEMLTELADSDDGRYQVFYTQFSKNLKLGVYEEETHRVKLAGLLRFSSSMSGGNQTSLSEYVSRMGANQSKIYYIAGESEASVRASPFVEALTSRGLEVLFMVDPIDEYVMQSLREFDGKAFACITTANLQLDPVDGGSATVSKEEQSRLQALCNMTKQVLGNLVQNVVLSSRLANSPCVLVTDEWGWTANMERIMRAQALRDPTMTALMAPRKTLELNPAHMLVRSLAQRVGAAPGAAASSDVEEAMRLLYETALLDSGFSIDAPSEFTARIHRLLSRSMSA